MVSKRNVFLKLSLLSFITKNFTLSLTENILETSFLSKMDIALKISLLITIS